MTTASALIDGGRLSWPLLLPEKCRALDQIEENDYLDAIFTMAAEFLWRWTGARFGLQEVTHEPYHRQTSSWDHGSTFYGRGPGGSRQYPRFPVAEYAWTYETDFRKIYLAAAHEIVDVKIDGEVLPNSAYELQGSVLVRTDGKTWPRYQKPTLQVTYWTGREVPQGGQVAAGVLACEFAMSIKNDPNCSLPQRLQSVTREGVSMTVMDEFDDLDDGRTGIWLIDNWVASVTKSPRGGLVATPEATRFGGLR